MPRARSFASIVAAALVLIGAATGRGAEPWAGEPLAGDAKAIARRAAELAFPAESGLEVLYHHVAVEFDDAGRKKQTLHRVWRCTHPSTIESLALLEAAWAPWHQQRPVLKARGGTKGVRMSGTFSGDPGCPDYDLCRPGPD